MKASPDVPVRVNRMALPLAWGAALLGLGLFVVVLLGVGSRQRLATESFEEGLVFSKDSMTGYEKGARRWLLLDNNQTGYHAILQAQALAAQGGLRLRTVTYDNAPEGRPVASASPYRWWLVMLGWIQQKISGHPLGAAIEEASLFADGSLFLAWLAVSTVWVWRRQGATAGAWWVAVASLAFPFSAAFASGAPEESGLALLLLATSALLLLPRQGGKAIEPRDAVVSGVFLGLSLWIVPEVGLFAGLGIAAAGPWTGSVDTDSTASANRWRRWACAAAVVISAAYLFEAVPERLAVWSLSRVHVFHALILFGVVEASVALRMATTPRNASSPAKFKTGLWTLLGLLPLAVAVFFCFREPGQGLFSLETNVWRFTKLPEAPVGNVAAIFSNGAFLIGWFSAVGLIAAAVTGCFLKSTAAEPRRGAVLVGGVVAVLTVALFRNSLWGAATALALPLAAVQLGSGPANRLSQVFSAVGVATGALALWICTPAFTLKEASYAETLSLVERDLSRWLVKHGPKEGAVVFAAPQVTTGVLYYGGLRGVATLAPENRAGTLAAIRLCSASSDAEARALVTGRGVTHVVLASWDTTLADLGRLGGGQFSGSFIKALTDWRLPYWLRPLPYPMPRIAGFEGQTLWVFEVVDAQDPAIAACRTADFLLELGQASSALPTSEVLRRYPNNLSAWVARASIELANDQKDDLAASLKVITQKLTAKADKIMPWDRRVSLAILLARVKETELSKAQTARCLKDAKEENVRQLTPGGVYLLEVLAKRYALDFEDPDAKKLAWERLNDDAREQLK